MREYIDIGPAPCDEECAQIGTEGFDDLNRKECARFIEVIRSICGTEPEGARLSIKGNRHDFGTYREVVCYYDDQNETATNYAFHVEGNAPQSWTGEGGKKFETVSSETL